MKKPIDTRLFALKIISRMDQLHRKEMHPSNPYIHEVKFSEKSANDIEKAIERFAKIVGFLAERTKVQGRQMNAKWTDTPLGRVQTQQAKFVTGTGRKGSSDMKLLIKGDYITAEIKFGKDTQKADQKKYQADVERNGGEYVIFKTFEQFLIWYVERYGRPAIMQQAIDSLK